MAKLKKSKLIPLVLFSYTILLGILLFPYFYGTGRLVGYFCIIGIGFFFSWLLSYLYKKQNKKDNGG